MLFIIGYLSSPITTSRAKILEDIKFVFSVNTASRCISKLYLENVWFDFYKVDDFGGSLLHIVDQHRAEHLRSRQFNLKAIFKRICRSQSTTIRLPRTK